MLLLNQFIVTQNGAAKDDFDCNQWLKVKFKQLFRKSYVGDNREFTKLQTSLSLMFTLPFLFMIGQQLGHAKDGCFLLKTQKENNLFCKLCPIRIIAAIA